MYQDLASKKLQQIIPTLKLLKEAPEFIRNNKLWGGYFTQGWPAKVSLICAALFSFLFVNGVINQFTSPASGVEGISVAGITSSINKDLFSGANRYLLLILLEMLIFHFSVKTLEVLSRKEIKTTPRQFIKAQIRMIKVAFRNWIYELIFSIVAAIILGILGGSTFKPAVILVIQFYFTGYVFIDNYNEQFGIKIKESAKVIYEHAGAAIAIGAVAYVLFMIPIVGIVIASLICAVAATCYMFYYSDINPQEDVIDEEDLELV